MSAILVPLVFALAGPGAPAIVLTPASEAPAAVLSTRCAPSASASASASADANEVECIVEAAHRAGPATVMRISIHTPRATPCTAADAASVAIPAAEGPQRPRSLPLVVQEPRQRRCDR